MPSTGLKRPESRSLSPRGTPVPATRAGVAGPDEFLQALARAVQQFHTYPPESTMCQNALDACARALAGLQDLDQVHCRVTPHELIVNDRPTGRGTIVEQELSRRLHDASVAEVTVERAITPRELSRFCLDLLRCSGRTADRPELVELLGNHGVDRITLLPAYRPEVLSVGPPEDSVAALVASERRRREQMLSAPGAINYLYPPDKGWVRLDPSSPVESISLVELALLAESPSALATMLVRLTDDAAERLEPSDALARRFSDVTMLFSALEPRLARVMFAKLARAVLDLNTERRQALLRRTILPGLLDGRTDGSVLRDFPDIDLADSLCLLLDLETAAPEVVTTALARLDLPAERHAALSPLIDERLQQRGSPALKDGLHAHARRLTTVKDGATRSFAEFSAFDLALDAETAARIVEIRDRIAAPEKVDDRLDCLARLIGLEPNPDTVVRFLDRAAPLTAQLEAQGGWDRFAAWLHRCRTLADTLGEARPDVAQLLAARLAALCTPERAVRIVDLASTGDSACAFAQTIVEALGASMGPALLAVVQSRSKDAGDPRVRTAAQLLCDSASVVAPAVVDRVGQTGIVADRVMARVFGLAGAGYEPALGALLSSADEQTVREALRSLARIGSARAAALVSARIQEQDGWAAVAAEESLWRFPAGEAQRQARALLGRREFVVRYAEVAGRLLERTAQGHRSGLDSLLVALAPLRIRIWNPPVARLGRRAKAMMAK